MRNIADYEQQYMEHPFERTQEGYRRKQIKSMIGYLCKSWKCYLRNWMRTFSIVCRLSG